MLDIAPAERNIESLFFCPAARLGDSGIGNIETGNMEAMSRQKDTVAAFAAGNVESFSARADILYEVNLLDQER